MVEPSLAGVPVNGLLYKNLFAQKYNHIVTLNAEIIVQANENPQLAEIIKLATTTIDGTIPYWLMCLKYPGLKLEKLAGSDLIYRFCDTYASGGGIFLLGGDIESNRLSVGQLAEQYPGLKVSGYSFEKMDYPFSNELDIKILASISQAKPDVLFVGFGAPKQEYWIFDHEKLLMEIGVKIVVGCGGTFEFVSGRIQRAPKWTQAIGMEGIYRLMREPRWFRVKRIYRSLLIFKYLWRGNAA
jgi:N-acetylglucosaminyldiphosphoundecaprenol N-acetyl-beta-D-mannosaminyltransferase